MTTQLFQNPRHNFGYINLPSHIRVEFEHDKDAVCWSPFALIEKEIFKSEVDIMVRIGFDGPQVYFGKATALKVKVGMRFLRIDTTNCPSHVFEKLADHVGSKPWPRLTPFLVSMHIDQLIKNVHIEASTLIEDETGLAKDTVLNCIVLTLEE